MHASWALGFLSGLALLRERPWQHGMGPVLDAASGTTP
jgi:hypothetical protein